MKRRPRLPLRHQQANENINNFYSKEMEANLIENNSSDLSLHVNKRRTEKFRRRHKTLQASLCVRRDGGGEDGGERKFSGKTRKADTKNPRKKQTKERKLIKNFQLKSFCKDVKRKFSFARNFLISQIINDLTQRKRRYVQCNTRSSHCCLNLPR